MLFCQIIFIVYIIHFHRHNHLLDGFVLLVDSLNGFGTIDDKDDSTGVLLIDPVLAGDGNWNITWFFSTLKQNTSSSLTFITEIIEQLRNI